MSHLSHMICNSVHYADVDILLMGDNIREEFSWYVSKIFLICSYAFVLPSVKIESFV